MTTTVTHQSNGFFVQGLRQGWDPDLDGLARYINAQRITWANTERTSLFVVCDNSGQVANQLLEILNGRGLTDWRQKVTFVPLDKLLTAVVFEHKLPTGILHALFDHEGIETVVSASTRTLVLIHPDKFSDERTLDSEQAVWRSLCEQDVPSNAREETPYKWLQPRVRTSQLIELDETTVAVRIKSTKWVNAESLCNKGVNFVRVGTSAVVLGAGERPAPTVTEPERTERPTVFEYTAGLICAVHELTHVPDGMLLYPEPVLITI